MSWSQVPLKSQDSSESSLGPEALLIVSKLLCEPLQWPRSGREGSVVEGEAPSPASTWGKNQQENLSLFFSSQGRSETLATYFYVATKQRT